MRKLRKAKKPKRTTLIDGQVIKQVATHQKLTGDLYVRKVKAKTKTNLLLAWQIQKAEANY